MRNLLRVFACGFLMLLKIDALLCFMPMKEHPFSFHKTERLQSRRRIESLFAGGKKSMAVFPLRAVYVTRPADGNVPGVSTLMSVSKRRFKHAVDRNRVKRQIREAYRCNKQILCRVAEGADCRLDIAFIWLSDKIYATGKVESCVVRLLTCIAEQIQANQQKAVAGNE